MRKLFEKNKLFKKKNNTELILKGNLFRAILMLAVPIIINSMLQTMYNLTDTYWLGQLSSEEPMAAISLISPMQNIIINFGQGITLAGAILISQLVGAGYRDKAKLMANQVFMSSMIFSVLCAAACFVATPYIVGWLGAEGNVFDFSNIYLRIVVMDMPFLFMINIYTAVNQAQGNTIYPMYLNFFGIAINMILDPLFMIVFDWGITGVALSTLLAKVPCAAIAFIALRKKTNEIRLEKELMRPDKEMLLKIVKLGLPTAIGSSTMQFGFLLMTKNVLKYGNAAMAAYGIGNKVNGIITMPSNAMGSAVGTIVGQNIGANQYDRAERAYKLARNMAVCFLFIGGMILSRPFISTAIVSIFSKNGTSDVVLYAADFLSIMAFYCWTNGIYNATIGLFQGSGHTMVTMAVDASRLWVFRFLTLFICEVILDMGVRSVWYSVVASNGISSLILWILFMMKIWRRDTTGINRDTQKGGKKYGKAAF